ncbi:putative ribonuclease H-like domain-containing protein [Tanacetum coccineum]
MVLRIVNKSQSDNSKENSEESLVEEQVSQDTSSFVESSPNVDKETVFPVNKKVEFTKPKNHEKPVKKSVRYAEMYRSQSPRGNQRNWNGQKSNQLGKDFVMYNKACFICGSFNHLQINCDNYQRKGIVSRNNYSRVDAKTTHPSVHRNMSPKAVLLKTGLTPLNTVRPVNTAHPKSAVHSAKSKSHFSKQAQSTAQRPFYKQTTLTRKPMHTAKRHYYTGRPRAVNVARSYTGQVSVVRVKWVNAGMPQQDDKGFVDNGCSRHMTENIAYLSDFKEFDGGYVAFGGGAYGGRITGKGTLKTDNLDFEDDETSEILKNFIKEIENLVDKKVKIIRSDNGTEFKNKVLDDFAKKILGKLNGKSDEGSLLIFLSSNAFKVQFLMTLQVHQKISQDCICDANLERILHILIHLQRMFENDDSSTKDVNVTVQHVNTVSPDVNTGSFKLNDVGPSVNTASSNEQDSPKDEPKVDLVNITNSYIVPTTPNTRIHKDHPIDNVISDVKSTVQTRRMTKPTSKQGFLSNVKNLCYSNFNGFWIFVDLPIRKRAIGTKWSAFLYGTIEEEVYVTQPPGFKDPDHPDKVYKVVKALYGLHQAPRAWYETLANYLLGNGFKRGKIDQTLFIKKQKGDILLVQVYVDDIIFGSTNKELCTGFEKLMKDKFQMSSMGELTFFLGLQVQQKEDGIFISQDKYVAEILKKFNYTNVKSASTPVDLEKPLVKDGDADDVDVHLYRSMIGSLMYLTASRPDIMFAVCACARFQVTPKTSHLLAVKRIFRYLKGKPTLGLWYSRDSPFELVAYTDSDYAGATQDRKSTTGGCKLKRGRDTKIPQSSGPPVKVGDEAIHKELGDRMERASTTASSLEAEQDSEKKKPPTKAQKGNLMPLPILNNHGWIQTNQLNSKSYEGIQKLFDNEIRRVNTFIPMDSKVVKSAKETERNSKEKQQPEEQQQESSKRQRMEDNKETDEHEEVDEAELKKHLVIVKDDDIAIDAIPLGYQTQ